jgi:hypothetical protein
VPDVEYDHIVFVNREQHTVLVWLAAIEQLANLKREFFVFGGQWAAVGEFGKGGYRLFHSLKPAQSRFAGLMRQQLFEDGI